MEDYLRAFSEYEKFARDDDGKLIINHIDDTLTRAYVMVACDALENHRDKENGLIIAKSAKEVNDALVAKMTQGAEFWDVEEYAKKNKTTFPAIEYGYEIYRAEAPYKFESYCYYMEKNRDIKKRFYKPRRKTLKIVVDDLQDLEDGIIKIYGLSMPSRVGKSGIGIFFLSWVGYRKPNSHSAMGGHSGQLAKRFFRGYDNLVEVPEYTFNELFQRLHPGMKTLETKSSDPAEFTINLGEPDEFATLSCRGVDGTWTGAIDVSSDGYLYIDDMVRDREHSMSPSRMENTYQEYQNKMLDRCNDGAGLILVGTLWGVLDIIERERKRNEDNPKARFRKIPALNEQEESNFQYEIKGFSTRHYLDMRDRLEKPEWMAKYQQSPFVREGLTFPIEELRFFDGIIPEEKHRTVATCDAAFGGGDSLSMPICKDFEGNRKYIVGWVHDKRSPEYTVSRVVDAIERYAITLLWFEKNSGGQLLAEKVQKEMDARGVVHCRIELYSAPVKMHKEDKINGYSDYVKRNFQFLLPKAKKVDIEDENIFFANEDYRKAIDELTMWSAEGKKQHDDAPDAISSLAMKLTKTQTRQATITGSWI